jgi:hypothetical protein
MVLLAASCRGGSGGDRATADTGRTKEAKLTMTTRYEQPCANAQLNSYVDAPVKAAGRLALKLPFNPSRLPGSPRDLYVVDEKRAVLDAGDVFFAIDMSNRTVLGFRDKSANSFIALGAGTQFFFVYGYQLFRRDFEHFRESGEDYFVPGLGEYSVLRAFRAGAETFLAGVQGLGNPRIPEPRFEWYEKEYGDTERLWSHAFDGMAVAPPVDASGTAVVAHGDTVTVVDRAGTRTEIVVKPFRPISCSIGPDGLLYLVGEAGAGTALRVCALTGEVRWELPAAASDPLQPPIVNADGVVYLVDASRVTAYQEGRRLWEFPILSPNARATAFRDIRLVVADGARVVCLDESGRALWSYEDKDGESFLTPPVVDPAGRVLVVSEKSIVVIE